MDDSPNTVALEQLKGLLSSVKQNPSGLTAPAWMLFMSCTGKLFKATNIDESTKNLLSILSVAICPDELAQDGLVRPQAMDKIVVLWANQLLERLPETVECA